MSKYYKAEDVIRAIAEQLCWIARTEYGDKFTTEDLLEEAEDYVSDLPTIEVSEEQVTSKLTNLGNSMVETIKGGFNKQDSKLEVNEEQLSKLKICDYFYKGYCSKYDDGCFHQCVQKQVSEDAISREYIVKKLKSSKEFYLSAWEGFSNMDDKDKARCDELDNCIATVINAPSVVPTQNNSIQHVESVGSVDERSREMSVEVINGMADTIAKLEEELQSYKDWVDLEDSVKIAECCHRYGGDFVVKACKQALEEALKGADTNCSE